MDEETADIEALTHLAHWFFFVSFLAVLVIICCSLLFSFRVPGKEGWLEAVLVCVSAATTIAGLARQLPLQNVLLAAGIAAVIGSAAHILNSATGMPFGPFTTRDALGPRLFRHLPWAIPFIWVISILSSRGVARLILRPWRKVRVYGYWLIGLTCILSVVLQIAFDPFATRVKHYWAWSQTRLPLDWHGAPLVSFFSWGLVVLLILAFATPALINKRPRRSPPDYHPLGVWLFLGILFATGAATEQLWSVVGFFAVTAIAVLILAVRGGTW